MNKRFITLVSAVILGAVALTGCGKEAEKKEAEKPTYVFPSDMQLAEKLCQDGEVNAVGKVNSPVPALHVSCKKGQDFILEYPVETRSGPKCWFFPTDSSCQYQGKSKLSIVPPVEKK